MLRSIMILDLSVILAAVGIIIENNYLTLIGFSIASMIAFFIAVEKDTHKYLRLAYSLLFIGITLEAIRALFKITDNSSKKPYIPYYDDPIFGTTISALVVTIVGILCILYVRDMNKIKKSKKWMAK